MSEPCAIEMCKSPSRTQCHCCKKSFCRTHFNEHDNLPSLQLNSMIDEINLLNDQLMAFNIDKLTDDSHQKLERWRAYCHRLIDDIFEHKCREIDRHANDKKEQQRSEITKIQSTITDLIRKQEVSINDIDLLKIAIRTVKEKINNMEQTCFRVIAHPLVIADELIRIEELKIPQLELLKLPSPYKKINHIDGSSRVIAINDRIFLIHKEPNLCLMNRELTVIKKSQWTHGPIWDMCWSSTLARFFVVTPDNVLTIDDNTMSIERAHINQKERWFSCTCSDTTLYLSTFGSGSAIFEFILFPSIQLRKQWTSPETCTQDQIIMNIVYQTKALAMTIVDTSNKDKLIEIRSATALDRLWSLRLDIEYSNQMIRCCSLNHNDWLVFACNTSRLLHISKDGKVQATSEYNEQLAFGSLFDGNKLLISTDKSINLHELKSVH